MPASAKPKPKSSAKTKSSAKPRSNTKKPRAKAKAKKRAFDKRRLWWLLLLLLLPLAACLDASLVRLRPATVYLRDLPAAFEGLKVLYVSDLHLDFFASPSRGAGLMEQLFALKPDLVLFGGDYASFGYGGGDHLDAFFARLKGLHAPYGKYGVRGNHDADPESLKASMALGDVRLLNNGVVYLKKGDASLLLAGIDDWTTGERETKALADQILRADCVLLLSHTPEAVPTLVQQPASDGGRLLDLILCGHTHGGQLNLFGWRPFLPPSAYGERYVSGWYDENGTPLLVSNGVGTLILPLRIGAPPEAHLITLKRLESRE